MEDMHQDSSEEGLESEAEMEKLDETTHEPGTQIEQTGNIQTAEAVENAFIELAEENPEVTGSEATGINTVSKIDSFTREGELEESVKSGEETPYLESPSGADISEDEVPDLEDPPIVDISAEGGYVKQMDEISKDPAYLEAEEEISKDPAYLEGQDEISKDPAYLRTSGPDAIDADSVPSEEVENDKNG